MAVGRLTSRYDGSGHVESSEKGACVGVGLARCSRQRRQNSHSQDGSEAGRGSSDQVMQQRGSKASRAKNLQGGRLTVWLPRAV